MKWVQARAAEWMLASARELGSDFSDMPYEEPNGGPGECLRASAGALWYGAEVGDVTLTEEAFRKWLGEQVGWDAEAINGAVRDICPKCENKSHDAGVLLYGELEAESYFECVECGRVVCTNCEGSTNKPELCDECWVPDKDEKP